MTTMTYDKGVGFPDTAMLIAQIAQQLQESKLGRGESLFVADFPKEQVAVLNSAIITGMNAAFYIHADEIYGGAGVRIWSLHDVKNLCKEEKRFVGDWQASRATSPVWKERIEKWFGFELNRVQYHWNSKEGRVEVVTCDDEPDFDGPNDWYRIPPATAFAWMCDEGYEYRAGYAEPPKPMASETFDLPPVNIWVGFKQVVWSYNVTDDVVKEFASHADADYEMDAKGVNYTFEDAPLIAWLGFNAAKRYSSSHKTDVVDTPNQTENVSDAELEEL